MKEAEKHRKTEYRVNKIFPGRWSPRAMTGEKINKKEMMPLFEAARWAPSSYNNQPWRFIYAMKDTGEWKTFFNLLSEWNRAWAKNAAVLIVVISKKTFDHNNKESRTHSLDTGAAWQNLALQGSDFGLVVHGMEGFDYDKAKEKLEIPEGYDIEMMIAIGKHGNKEELPEEMQKMETPSNRKSIKEIVFEGKFRGG